MKGLNLLRVNYTLRVFISLFFVSINSIGQPAIEWSYIYGGSSSDKATTICNAHNGGFIIGGTTTSQDGGITDHHVGAGYNIWLDRINNDGLPIWNKSYGSSSPDEIAKIISTNDNGYIFAGTSGSNSVDVTGMYICADVSYWVVKIDSSGNIEWQKTFGTCGSASGRDIIQCSDGGFLVSGSISSGGGDTHDFRGLYDIWLCKIDENGTMEWNKTLGGSDYEMVSSSIQTSDFGFLITGSTASNDFDVSGLHGINEDAWVVKIDSNGNIQWQKCFGGTGTDLARQIIPSGNNGFYLFSTTYSNDGDVNNNFGNCDFWVIRCDSIGNIQWQTNYGGNSREVLYSACIDVGGGFLLTGQVSNDNGMVVGTHGLYDFWVVKIDSIGNFIWGKSLGGSDDETPKKIIQTSDGGFLTLGYSKSNDQDVPNNLGIEDFWAVKLASPTTNTIELKNEIIDFEVFQKDKNIEIKFYSKRNQSAIINIYSTAGKNIFSKSISVNSGENNYNIIISKIASQVLILEFKGEYEGFSSKIFYSE